MPQTEGRVNKMRVQHVSPVEYSFRLSDEEVPMNALIGQRLSLTYEGIIECVNCSRQTKKSFGQGYCYPCFRSLAECDMCIVKPETCHFHEGTCREPDWGQRNCMQEHVVYLANSSGIKVGITRGHQVPTRWIDQGAVAALPVARVASRRISGLVEVAIAAHVSDRTDWRRMLRGDPEPVDLAARRSELLDEAGDALDAIRAEFGDDVIELQEETVPVEIDYPVSEYPGKVVSKTFDKNPVIEGTLTGIKGQYLILDTCVVNIRRHSGYRLAIGHG